MFDVWSFCWSFAWVLPRYVFSKCYREDSRASALRADEAFMMELEKIKVGGTGAVENGVFFCQFFFGLGLALVYLDKFLVVNINRIQVCQYH